MSRTDNSQEFFLLPSDGPRLVFDEHERARQFAMEVLVDPAEKKLLQPTFLMGKRDEKIDLFLFNLLQYLLFRGGHRLCRSR